MTVEDGNDPWAPRKGEDWYSRRRSENRDGVGVLKDGLRHGAWQFTRIDESKGIQIYNEGLLDGPSMSLYPDGALRTVSLVNDHVYDGPRIDWDEQGRLGSVRYLRDGRPDGPSRSFYPSGSVSAETSYRNGMRHGLERHWSEDGTLVWQAWFHHGCIHGSAVTWFPKSGAISESASFVYGLLHGLEQQFAEDGQLTSQVHWSRGRQVDRLGESVSLFDRWWEDPFPNIRQETHQTVGGDWRLTAFANDRIAWSADVWNGMLHGALRMHDEAGDEMEVTRWHEGVLASSLRDPKSAASGSL